MTRRRSIADARSNLPSLIREAEEGTPVELTRRGRPVAVLLGKEQYERLRAGLGRFTATYRLFREEYDLAELAIDTDAVFGAGRDRSPGRKVRL